MNKKWIRACHRSASNTMDALLNYSYTIDADEWLDITGLHETCWMIYDFDKHVGAEEREEYGYPL